MLHQIRRESRRICLLDASVCANRTVYIRPRDVYGRSDTVYPYHRVGYDGQKQVLPTQHAVLVLGQMLPVSVNSDQDSPPSAKAISSIHWYVRMKFCYAI